MRSRHTVFDSIGIYFSSTDFLFEKRSYNQLSPSLIFRDTSAITYAGDRSWRKISLDYIATGEEIFITIGSFKKGEYNFDLPPEYKGNYYLFLDNVSLVPANKHELPCAGADSIRSILYEQNERHSILEKKTTLNKKNVPVELKPPVTILQRIDTLIIPDILFATASAKLNENSFHLLDSFCTALASKHIDSLIINGHTDSVGTLMYNNKLSADRAASVTAYIKAKLSLNNNLFVIHYFAYLQPVSSNQTAAGRQRNRRVEIYLYTQE